MSTRVSTFIFSIFLILGFTSNSSLYASEDEITRIGPNLYKISTVEAINIKKSKKLSFPKEIYCGKVKQHLGIETEPELVTGGCESDAVPYFTLVASQPKYTVQKDLKEFIDNVDQAVPNNLTPIDPKGGWECKWTYFRDHFRSLVDGVPLFGEEMAKKFDNQIPETVQVKASIICEVPKDGNNRIRSLTTRTNGIGMKQKPSL